MKKDKGTKGFTLIELLVVIAIIGILSSVVLASLNSARAKGSDAAVKTGMGSLTTQAALYYDNNGQSYANLFSDPQVVSIVNNVTSNAASITTASSSASAYVFIAHLKSGGNWCIDSNNVATATAAVAANGLCQ